MEAESIDIGTRVTIDFMRVDERLARACALTCIALMGFTSVSSFEAYVSSDNARIGSGADGPDKRIRLVQSWLRNETHPMHADDPTQDLLLGAGDEDGARRAWSEGRDGIRDWELQRDQRNEVRVLSAIKPLLDVDVAVDGLDVRRIALASATPTENVPDSLTQGHVDAFKDVVERMKESGRLGIGHFGHFVRALVTGEPRTVTGRGLAMSCAHYLYGGMRVNGANLTGRELDDAQMFIAACERVPDPLGKAQWLAWRDGASNDLYASALERMGVGKETSALTVLERITKHVGNSPLAPGTEASRVYVSKIGENLRRACVDVSASCPDARTVHRESKAVLVLDNLPEDTQVDTKSEYVELLKGDLLEEASEWVLTNLGEGGTGETNRAALMSDVNKVDVTRIRNMRFSDAIMEDAVRIYTQAESCSEKFWRLERARTLNGYVDVEHPNPTHDLHKFCKEVLRPRLRTMLANSLAARYNNVNVPSTDIEMKPLDTFGNSMKSKDPPPTAFEGAYAYLLKGLEIIENVNPVRIAITFRTKKFGGNGDEQALQTARAMIGPQAGGVDARWSKQFVSLRFPKAGPFYSVMMNGSGVAPAIRKSIAKVLSSIDDRSTLPGGPPQHHIFSAYGLSGSGKTHTLLQDSDSVLRTLVRDLKEHMHPDGKLAQYRVEIAIMDAYGERRDDESANAGTAGSSKSRCLELRNFQARNYNVTYKKQSLELPVVHPQRGLTEAVAFEKHVRLDHLEQEFFGVTDDDLVGLPDAIARISEAKKEFDFAAESDHVPITHIRATPNNKDSSRAHTAISLRLVHRDAGSEVARFTLIDMAGAEDVDAIEQAYFATDDVTTYKISGHAPTQRGDYSQGLEKELLETIQYMPGLSVVVNDDAIRGFRGKLKKNFADQTRLEEQRIENHVMRVKPWADLYDANDLLKERVGEILECPPSAPALASLRVCNATILSANQTLDGMREKLAGYNNNVVNVLSTMGNARAKPFSISQEYSVKHLCANMRQAFQESSTLRSRAKGGIRNLEEFHKETLENDPVMHTAAKVVRNFAVPSKDEQTIPAYVIANNKEVLINEKSNVWRDQDLKNTSSRFFLHVLIQAAVLVVDYAWEVVFESSDKKDPETGMYPGINPQPTIRGNVDAYESEKKFPSAHEFFRALRGTQKHGPNTPLKNLLVEDSLVKLMNASDTRGARNFGPNYTANAPLKVGYPRLSIDSFNTAIDKLAKALSDSAESVINANKKVIDEQVRPEIEKRREQFERELRQYPSTFPKPSWFGDLKQQPLDENDLDAMLRLQKHVDDAHQLSDNQMKIIHCPLRYQGVFIEESIANIHEFTQFLNKPPTRQTPYVPVPWLKAMVGEPTKETQFVQIVAVRTDFPQNPSNASEDANVSARRDGAQQSIQFAQRLNPLDPT